MLDSGKKICASCDKKKNILTLVLSKKKILNGTKNLTPPPPFKLNGRSLTMVSMNQYISIMLEMSVQISGSYIL